MKLHKIFLTGFLIGQLDRVEASVVASAGLAPEPSFGAVRSKKTPVTKKHVMTELINATLNNDEYRFNYIFNQLSDEDKHRFANQSFDIPSENLKKWSLLHTAASNGNVRIAKSLVDAGANPQILSDRGATPLVYASAHGHDAVVHYLSSLPGPKNSLQYREALSHAAQNGHDSTVTMLMKNYPYQADDTQKAGRIAVQAGHEILGTKLIHANPSEIFGQAKLQRIPNKLSPVEHHHPALPAQEYSDLSKQRLVRHNAVAPLAHNNSALKYLVPEGSSSSLSSDEQLPSRPVSFSPF